MQKKTKNKFKYVNPEDNIAEVISLYPETAEVFLAYGLHCVGCFASSFDSITAGAQIHGMGLNEIEDMVKEVNYIVEENKKLIKERVQKS